MSSVVSPLSKGIVTAYVSALAFTGGCNTSTSGTAPAKPTPQDTRIAEYQGAYDAMPPVTQAELRQGRILLGNTPQMVYIALGKPDIITAGADGRRTIWTYSKFLPPEVKARQEADTQAKKKRQAAQRKAMASDPLIDTMVAWRYGALRHSVNDGEPDIAPKSANQTWEEYGRYIQERRQLTINLSAEPGKPGRGVPGGLTGNRQGGLELKALDDQAWDDYREAERTSPLPDPVFVRLDVILLGGQVQDTIVNESTSAFAPES